MSADEAAAIREAASAAGMAEASWVGTVVTRALDTRPGVFGRARGEMQELMVLRDEIAELHRVLRNIGGNLNQVAKHANSTGQLHAGTASVQQLVARVVEQVVDTVGHMDELAIAAGIKQPRRGRP